MTLFFHSFPPADIVFFSSASAMVRGAFGVQGNAMKPTGVQRDPFRDPFGPKKPDHAPARRHATLRQKSDNAQPLAASLWWEADYLAGWSIPSNDSTSSRRRQAAAADWRDDVALAHAAQKRPTARLHAMNATRNKFGGLRVGCGESPPSLLPLLLHLPPPPSNLRLG